MNENKGSMTQSIHLFGEDVEEVAFANSPFFLAVVPDKRYDTVNVNGTLRPCQISLAVTNCLGC